MELNNLFDGIPSSLADELFTPLINTPGLQVERIVSQGQGSEEDDWYDQPRSEWVVLLQGAAKLLFEEGLQVVELGPGDYLLIPAHCRHKVIWTPADQQSVWLAIHYEDGGNGL